MMIRTLSWRSVQVQVEMKRPLFAAEIYRMYVHYAESKHWKVESNSEMEEIGIGGMKSVTFMVTGQGAYSVLKYESGVHRVQRVPETESGGRIHTSTITVAVMPEAEDVDVVIDDKDIRIDVLPFFGSRWTVCQYN